MLFLGPSAFGRLVIGFRGLRALGFGFRGLGFRAVWGLGLLPLYISPWSLATRTGHSLDHTPVAPTKLSDLKDPM